MVTGHTLAMLDNANIGINRMKFITIATIPYFCLLSKPWHWHLELGAAALLKAEW